MKQIKLCSIGLVALVLSLATVVAQAQEQPTKPERPDHTPTKGAFELSVSLAGVNQSQQLSVAENDVYSSGTEVSARTHASTAIMLTMTPTLGADFAWFFTDQWSLQAGGFFRYAYQPGRPGKDGVNAPLGGEGNDDKDFDGSQYPVLPWHREVPSVSHLGYTLFVGANHHWKFKNAPNLVLAAGARFGFSYGLGQQKSDHIASVGTTASEEVMFRVSAPVGVKYYFARSFFVGAEISPVSYEYELTTVRLAPGFASHSADAHSVTFLDYPTIKIGFRF